jgi:CRP-like cAMP-binding protein
MNTGNHFLDSLDAADTGALQPQLKRVELKRDQALAEAGKPLVRIILPIDCVISVIIVMRDGRQVESRTIGRESGFGLLNALGSDLSFESVIVQVAGAAFTLPRNRLADAASRSPTLLRQIVRHAQATIVQAAQSTACNALHDVRQRLCRWLLLTQDRLGRDQLALTQEHLSIMLGVQRTTVTAIASQMQRDGIITYSRGKLTVLDRAALLAGACECYAVIERSAQRTLHPPAPEPA